MGEGGREALASVWACDGLGRERDNPPPRCICAIVGRWNSTWEFLTSMLSITNNFPKYSTPIDSYSI